MKSMIKPAVLVVMLLLMFIPVMMVYNVIKDRAHNRDIAKASIEQSWTGGQNLSGPWLVVNFESEYDVKITNTKNQQTSVETHTKSRSVGYRPVKVKVDGDLAVSYRYRKIFKVPVYQTKLKSQAQFQFDALHKVLTESPKTTIKSAYIEYRVSDQRGLMSQPVLTLNDQALPTKPSGAGFKSDVTYLFDRFNKARDTQAFNKITPLSPWTLKLSMTLAGMERLSFEPSALDNDFSLTSSWPHPSFTGDFLPTKREISDKGFKAQWLISAFATGVNDTPIDVDTIARKSYNNLGAMASMVKSYDHSTKRVTVKLYDPIDVYVLNDRAAKYAMLFIVLVFAVFYLFELLKQHQVHPIKYGLVGLSLSIFFLLLLSFSEKIGFVPAYFIAAGASVSLISFYMQPEFGKAGTIGLSTLLVAMFGTILVILKLESESLIVGSVLAFAVLAMIMILTRKINAESSTRLNTETKLKPTPTPKTEEIS